MLKIARTEAEGRTIFALSGRIAEGDVPELNKLFHGDLQFASITLDLQELQLVDRHGVRFLADCEAHGIQLKNCPAYVRQWMGTRSDEP